MNRRTVLRSAGTLTAVGLAGCLGNLQNPFEGSVRNPIPIEITSEADRYYNVHIEAYERGSDRKTYEKSVAMTPGQTASLQRLDGIDQLLRVVQLDDDYEEVAVEEVAVTADTQYVTVVLSDDGVEIQRGGADAS